MRDQTRYAGEISSASPSAAQVIAIADEKASSDELKDT